MWFACRRTAETSGFAEAQKKTDKTGAGKKRVIGVLPVFVLSGACVSHIILPMAQRVICRMGLEHEPEEYKK